MKAILAVTLLALAVATPAKSAERLTGSDLKKYCSAVVTDGGEIRESIEPDKRFDAGICLGFLRGMTGTNSLYEVKAELEKKNTTVLFCAPDELPVGPSALIVMKYLRSNPEALTEDWIFVAAKAFMLAWPCGAK